MLLEQIEKAGIVGCGGAGFPTDIKLKNQCEFLLINGAECEPLLRTDRYLMINKADEIVQACMAAASQIGARKRIIAVKSNYREEIKALDAAIQRHGDDIEIKKMDNFYPAGDEHVVVCEAAGRVVPPGGIPLDVGAVVSNVGTMFHIHEAMNGQPFTRRFLTVTGEVGNPSIISAPIGTSVEECIRLAGGAKGGDYFMINGGPMMGQPIPDDGRDQAYIGKTTSGILVLAKDSNLFGSKTLSLEIAQKRAGRSCIQCNYCTMLCPRYLLGHPLEPHKIMRLFASSADVKSMEDSPVMRSAQLCSQCEVCSIYACPMGIDPSAVNKAIKAELAQRGIRPAKGDPVSARSDREWRKVPSKRIAARAGVVKYYDQNITNVVTASPYRVCLSLRQGVGGPSEAIVRIGDKVEKGQLIAKRPEGGLAANLHASIAGRVVEINESICIKGD